MPDSTLPAPGTSWADLAGLTGDDYLRAALKRMAAEASAREGILDLDALAIEQGGEPGKIQPRLGGIFLGLWSWFMGLSLAAQIFVGVLAIAGLMFVARLLQRPLFDVGDVPRTYGFNARRNTSGVGLPIPIIYGEHRQFPPIIQQYIDVVDDKEVLYTLFAVSEGPIESIGTVEINEQPIERYTGVAWATRLGTDPQDAIPWFQDTRNTYAVGVDLLDDGRAFTYRTVTRIDDFIVKVKFPPLTGGGSVSTSPTTITVRVEHKLETDTVYTSLGDVPFVLNTRKPVTKAISSAGLSPVVTRFPVTLADDAGVGTVTWANPSNARLSDDVYATATFAGAGQSHYLKATDLGAPDPIPMGATILGIQVEVERSMSSGSATDTEIRLLKAGVAVGDNLSTGSVWPLPGTSLGGQSGDVIKVFGGPTSLWGTTWTPGDLNDSAFGVILSCSAAAAAVARVDMIRVKVWYSGSGTSAAGRRDIRVTRVSTSTSDKPPMSFDSADEIIYGSVANTYPNVALLGTQIQASEQLNGEPKQSALVRGRKVRPLSGGALGTTEVWSESPVECLIDAMTNTRYGLGRYISDADLVLSAFQSARGYCAEYMGGEPRHLLDLIMDEQKPAGDWLEQILNTFRGLLVEGDGKYQLVVDHLRPTSQVFTDANIIRGSFQTSWVSLSEEYDQVEVFYLDRDNYWLRDSVKIPSTGTKTKAIQLFGVTRRTHAQREAQYHYNVISQLSRFAEWDASLEALACQVGDVVMVSHQIPRWSWGGRVVAVTTADAGVNHVITVDRDDLPTVGLSSYALAIRQVDDAIETKSSILSVSAPYTSTEGYPLQDVKVSGLFVLAPTPRDAGWVFGPTTNLGKLFQIMEISLSENKTRHLRVFEYDPTVYVGLVTPPYDLMFVYGGSDDYCNAYHLNNAQVWQSLPLPTARGELWIDEADGKKGLFQRRNNGFPADENRLWRTDDGGETWTQLTDTPAQCSGCGIILKSGVLLTGRYVLENRFTIFRSTDNGASWNVVEVSASVTNTVVPKGSHFWQLASGAVLVVSQEFVDLTSKCKVWRSPDDGATWTLVLTLDILPTLSIWAMAHLTHYGGMLYAVGQAEVNAREPKLYRSVDGGLNWTLVLTGLITEQFMPNERQRGPLPMYLTDGSWLLPLSNTVSGKQYRSLDNGATWTGETAVVGTPSAPIHRAGSTLYAATGSISGALVSSVDQGARWYPASMPSLGGQIRGLFVPQVV